MSTTTTGFIDYDGLVPVPETDGEVDALGLAIEEFACEYYGYVHDRSPHYDAIGTDDTPVQIKGAGWRIKNGRRPSGSQKYTHGRFRLYECDHEYLLEHDGKYAFVVYERTSYGLVPLYARELPADAVGSFVLDDDDWYSADGSVPKREGGAHRVAWPRVFPNGVAYQ